MFLYIQENLSAKTFTESLSNSMKLEQSRCYFTSPTKDKNMKFYAHFRENKKSALFQNPNYEKKHELGEKFRNRVH